MFRRFIVEIVLAEAWAEVDTVNGRAIVYDSEKIYTIDLSQHNGEPKEDPGVHRSRFLQPAMNDVCVWDSGEYPYTELRDQLHLKYRTHFALRMFVVGYLDPDESIEIKTKAREALEPILEDQLIKDALLRALLTVPLPSEVVDNNESHTGHGGEIFQQVIKKWRG